MGHPTAGQKIVRSAFKKSCNCFNLQPDAGGATPPDPGPRDKAWWHTDSLSSGLRYYNYFMHKTEPIYLAGTVPDWCRDLITDDAGVYSWYPNSNYGGMVNLGCEIIGAPTYAIWRCFLKTPQAYPSKKLFLYCYTTMYSGAPRLIGCYQVNPDHWQENTITWNNQPVYGALIDSFIIPSSGWYAFDIGSAESVCIKVIDESDDPPNYRHATPFRSSDNADKTLRPYVSQ